MWDRRRLLASLTLISAIGGTFRHAGAQPTRAMAPSMPGMAPGMMTAQACIESCWRSHVMCLETERYCLEKGGMHAMPAHLALLADCAEMCQKTANSLLRRSPQHAVVCIACTQLCDACAQDCEAFKFDEGIYLKQQLKDKLVEHRQYIDRYGEDMPGNPELEVGKFHMNTQAFIATPRGR